MIAVVAEEFTDLNSYPANRHHCLATFRMNIELAKARTESSDPAHAVK